VRKKNRKVESLHADPKPDQSRIRRIRQWFLSQAAQPEHPVAALSIAITWDGSIIARSIHIDPIHASLMLPELERIANQFQSLASAPTHPEPFTRVG
jgi:hypothetical protein